MEKPIIVQTIVSDRGRSEKRTIELFPKEIIEVGDELMWDDHNLLVTAIESNNRRVDKAEASSISCIWFKLYDTVIIKVAIVQGPNTKSETLQAAPEEEFAVGDLLDLGRTKVVVTKIKTAKNMVYREGSPVQARNVRRVYSKRVEERRR